MIVAWNVLVAVVLTYGLLRYEDRRRRRGRK